MEYDLEARRRLGRAVRSARRAAGLSKTAEWADRVGRSDRVVLGVERGEPAGPDTYGAIAQALGWPLDRVYALLDDREVAPDEASSPTLAAVSDEELAAEVLRRMKSGGEHGGDTAPTKPALERGDGYKYLVDALDTTGAKSVSLVVQASGGKFDYQVPLRGSWWSRVREIVEENPGPETAVLQELLDLSAAADRVPVAVAAHEEEGSIAGEQEESDTP